MNKRWSVSEALAERTRAREIPRLTIQDEFELLPVRWFVQYTDRWDRLCTIQCFSEEIATAEASSVEECAADYEYDPRVYVYGLSRSKPEVDIDTSALAFKFIERPEAEAQRDKADTAITGPEGWSWEDIPF